MTSSSLRWRCWRWAAAFASLALLAGNVAAENAPRSAPYRSSASRYAARQVRVPDEETATPAKSAAKSAAPKVIQHDVHVQPVQLRQSSARSSQEFARLAAHPAQRASTRMLRARGNARFVQDGEVTMEEGMTPEMIPAPQEEMMMEEGGSMLPSHSDGDCGAACGDGACGADGCGDCGSCFDCCCIRIPCLRLPRLDNIEIFAGAQGFTGPPNAGSGGSFGFHEGVNWGRELRLPCRPCNDSWLSGQLGFQAVQSNFAGSDITSDNRRQFFVTGGFFRRVDWGLQGGAVIDFMHDEWYYDQIDLAQVRGEVSWVFPCRDELGFWFTQGLSSATSVSTFTATPNVITSTSEGWVPTDLYAMFYRRQLEECNGTARIFAGFTGESDGLVGADFNLPIAERWAVRTDFTYLIATENHSTGGFREESWNVGLSLVWYPGCRTARSPDYHRPLLNVADNGSFMVDRE